MAASHPKQTHTTQQINPARTQLSANEHTTVEKQNRRKHLPQNQGFV
jgi:hypothetical protein